MDTLTEMRKEYLRAVMWKGKMYKRENVKFNIEPYIKIHDINVLPRTLANFHFTSKQNVFECVPS